MKSGTYHAPPVRRVHIPKGTGNETRPIGIPTLEDKVLQRAVLLLLEPLCEPLFHAGSYGFRPGRSAHQALESLWKQLMDSTGGWLLDVDIRKFFDTLDHGHLQALLRHRVRDGVLLRLIGKWLNAGVLEDGELSHPDEGTPQGGVMDLPARRHKAGERRDAPTDSRRRLPTPLLSGLIGEMRDALTDLRRQLPRTGKLFRHTFLPP